MDPKEISSLISALETARSVENKRLLGVCVWPVIRNSIFSILEERTMQTSSRRRAEVRPFGSFLLFLSSLFKFRRGARLLLTDAKFSEDINGALHYKEYEALSDLFAADNVRPMVAVFGESKVKVRGQGAVISFEFIKMLASFLAKLISWIHSPKSVDKDIKSVLDYLISSGVEVESRAEIVRKVTSNIIFVSICSMLISVFLRISKPKKAYVVCYYSLVGMAFCAACRNLNIVVVDIQHGVSGKYHRAYSHWNAIDGKLPNTLPSEYWVWSKKDYEQLSAWCNSSSQARALLKGNIWRDFFVRSGQALLAQQQWSFFSSALEGYDKRIVITLQENCLSPLLKSVILNSPNSWAFLIRVHPSFISSSSWLSENELPNVYYRESSNMPISILMGMVDFNITMWSASVYDAIIEGVPSIVTTLKGRDYFEDFIKDGIVFFEFSYSEVIRVISECK